MLPITIHSAIYYITIYNPGPRALLLLGGLESNSGSIISNSTQILRNISFYTTKVEFLGFIITTNSIIIDPS